MRVQPSPLTHDLFVRQLVAAVGKNLATFQRNNRDRIRHPDSATPRTKRLLRFLHEGMLSLADRAGFTCLSRGEARLIAARLANVLGQSDGLFGLLQMLADDRSRRTLVELLAFRILGDRRFKLSRNNSEYWDTVRRTRPLTLKKSNAVAAGHFLGRLDEYDLKALGFSVTLTAHFINVLNTFALQQYRYAHAPTPVEACPGDVVIDGGGCWGDTALYLAEKVGGSGAVYCFEFCPSNLALLETNLALNPHLKGRIAVVTNALWDRSGDRLEYVDAGPASVMDFKNGSGLTAETLAIDDFVARQNLPRVDWIKLDVEGAELKVLQGAEATIRKYRPKLAVALYHSLSDFVSIPGYLRGLGLDYEYYLDHFTIHAEETILFARPSASVTS